MMLEVKERRRERSVKTDELTVEEALERILARLEREALIALRQRVDERLGAWEHPEPVRATRWPWAHVTFGACGCVQRCLMPADKTYELELLSKAARSPCTEHLFLRLSEGECALLPRPLNGASIDQVQAAEWRRWQRLNELPRLLAILGASPELKRLLLLIFDETEATWWLTLGTRPLHVLLYAVRVLTQALVRRSPDEGTLVDFRVKGDIMDMDKWLPPLKTVENR